jgi:hypothetical protein
VKEKRSLKAFFLLILFYFWKMIGKAGEKAYAYPSPRFMLYSDVVIVFNIDLATTFVASAYGFHDFIPFSETPILRALHTGYIVSELTTGSPL